MPATSLCRRQSSFPFPSSSSDDHRFSKVRNTRIQPFRENSHRKRNNVSEHLYLNASIRLSDPSVTVRRDASNRDLLHDGSDAYVINVDRREFLPCSRFASAANRNNASTTLRLKLTIFSDKLCHTVQSYKAGRILKRISNCLSIALLPGERSGGARVETRGATNFRWSHGSRHGKRHVSDSVMVCVA